MVNFASDFQGEDPTPTPAAGGDPADPAADGKKGWSTGKKVAVGAAAVGGGPLGHKTRWMLMKSKKVPDSESGCVMPQES